MNADQTPAKWFRAQDAVILGLFVGMAAITPTGDPWEMAMICALGALQLTETRVSSFQARRLGTRSVKVVWILAKMAICYLLIGYTGGINSAYYVILLVPVVTAATSLGVFGTLLFSIFACAEYLSFLFLIDWNLFRFEPDQQRMLGFRLIILALAGTLVNSLADALRIQSMEQKAIAEQLADANRHLQEAEAEVRRSERLAALGQLSAGLAHELRNPLGTIKASAEMLTRSMGENEVTREVAGFISTEVDRTNSLVTRFLDFARPLHLRMAVADLGQVIDRAVEQVARQRGAKTTIYRNYSPDLPCFPIDAELMERVFYNLILNAAEASPDGAAVTVKTKLVDGWAEAAVIDRGEGIAADKREVIFNPFVTTKPTGVGLGLAIVTKIVDEHGGKIAVESEPGKGSVFRVSLPIR